MINAGVSDLWFNHDHSAYRLDDGDPPSGDTLMGAIFDIPAMRKEAEVFLGALASAGIDAPSVDALMADFERRL